MPATIPSEGKTVTAIYRPFGSSHTPVYDSGWRFPEAQYTYYMAAQKARFTFEEISGKWVLKATLDMVNPDNYVQFWVADAEASNEMYNLSTDAVIPTGFASVAADGSVVETTDKSAGDAMLGYKYQGGYLFSGKLDTLYKGTGYYFIKDNYYGEERRDYLVTGKALTSHSAVKLPANGNDKWIQVGSSQYIELMKEDNSSLGTWCTCNYGASLPEQVGITLTFGDAVTQHAASKDQFQALLDNCTWAWMTVKGQGGMGVKAATGFLFLPAQDGTSGPYWSSTEAEDVDFLSWDIYFDINVVSCWWREDDRLIALPVRPIQQ